MKTYSFTHSRLNGGLLQSLALAGVLAAAGVASAQNLISNGGFEANTGANGGNATGWIKDGGAYGIYKEPSPRGGPHSGTWAYVDGSSAISKAGVYQNLASPLVAGASYTLTFWSNPWKYTNNGVDVRVGMYIGPSGVSGSYDTNSNYSPLSLAVVSVCNNAVNTWAQHSYTFTAVGGETNVYFGSALLTSGDGADIDDVSLTPAVPPVPTGLVATPVSGQVGLNWTASPGATGYNVWTSNSVTTAVVMDTTAGPPFTKTGLDDGTVYYFMVSATNSAGASAYSTQVSATPSTAKNDQTITFALGTAVTKIITNAPFADTAIANGGMPITYSSDNTNVATVNASGTVTIVATGTAHILADQAGDASWNPAQASQTLTVNLPDQTITFTLGLTVSKLPTSAPFADTATASSGLPVTYSSDNTNVATVDTDGTVTIVAVGTANILADQAGNTNWNPAPQASQALTVGNIAAWTQNSASPIVFDNTQTLVGAAVFGNPGTYDGIPFSLWSSPFTTTNSLGSGVSVTMAVTGGDGGSGVNGTATGTTNQYKFIAFPLSVPRGLQLTFTGLDAGKQYLFQFGYGDKRTDVAYKESVTITLSDSSSAVVPLAYGSPAVGDEYALLTAIVTNTTSLVLDLPQTVSGYHGPSQAGFSVAVSPLDAPAGLVATPAINQVLLNWTPSFGATGYKVWTSNSVTHAVVMDTTAAPPFTKTNLNSGTNYFFMVAATNSVAESAYSAQVSATPTAAPGDQTITFALGANVTKAFGDAPFADTATASSALPVTYSSDNTNVATVNASGTVTIVAVGTANILADQAGNASWNPAPQASQALTVTKGDQTITFALGSTVSKLPTSGPFADTATASSGLPVTYSSDNPSVATVNASGNVTIVAVGTANILADQAGNTNWNPAPQASQTLTVGNVVGQTQNSASPIVFDNTQTLVGAAVFGNPGTYDGIPFALWSTPFTTTTLSLGEGVSVTMAIDSGSGGVTGATTLGTTNQYQYGAFPNSTLTGMTLTFTGLDAGKQYLFQFGYGDKRTIFDYNESVVLTLSDSTTTTTPLAYGSPAVGDEYALLTAIATNTTSLGLYLPSTHAGYHGITQAGFSVHRFGAPAAPTPVITSITGPVAGYFTILGTSSGAGNMVTLMTTNLASPAVWTPIQTNAVSSGPINILIPQGTWPAAYYRLMGQ